ncbi:MAG: RagB/SusD family nutrient uptake outer membrane protein [Bacteroidales bacterium]|nr:RagB/SusD family nutrient uptake outer membrane protein [Bacteroidales bacterium]
MNRPRHFSGRILLGILVLMPACSEDFLNVDPAGELGPPVLATYEGVDALLTGAYSMLDGVSEDFGWESATSGWVFSSIRGMESNKGTDAGDASSFNNIVTFSETAAWSWGYLDLKWQAVYESIARCNAALSTAHLALESGSISGDQYQWLSSQARALRGFYHFEAWRLWADRTYNRFVPYVDEYTDFSTLNNMEDIRDRIIADLSEGTRLPLNMVQVGRFNKSVSQVFLAKALMQMYGDYEEALLLLTEVEESGSNPAGQKAGLEARYGDVFDIEFRNGVESVYTVQYSVNDGSGGRNGGYAEALNFPYKSGQSPGGCCGFFQPTQDFVNSYRTGPDGLPLWDSYNEEMVRNDQGLPPSRPWDATKSYITGNTVHIYDPADPFTDLQYRSLTGSTEVPNVGNFPLTSPSRWAFDSVVFAHYAGNLDPRLDWSVGRRGIPYWDWGRHTGRDWVRDQNFAGPYSPKKQVYKKSQEGIYTEVGNWTSGFTANGYRMIRFADVLLLKAECEARTGTGDLGLGEVNAVRARAANPDGFVKMEDGTTPAANYVIGLYPSFPDPQFALKAIKFERRLELGQEGHRYYDLQRWGSVVSELSRILAYEKTMPWGRAHYGNAEVGPEDVNYPIPQRILDQHQGRFIQNR